MPGHIDPLAIIRATLVLGFRKKPANKRQPSIAEYGPTGLFLPFLDPDVCFFNLNCNQCGQMCPTKAVTTATEGKVRVPVVDEKICLRCGACQHVCPAKPNKAIYVELHTVDQLAKVPFSGKLNGIEEITDFQILKKNQIVSTGMQISINIFFRG